LTESVHVVCPHCAAVNKAPVARLREGPRCAGCKRALFVGKPVSLGTASFDRHVTRTDLPLVIDFWAPWCGPCHAMAPVLENAARRLEPNVRFAKLDTEAEPAIAARFGIRSIPTLIVFRGGREIGRQSGAMPLETLLAWIAEVTRNA